MKLFLRLLLISLLASPAFAQLTAWPTAGVVVNQLTTQVMLTEPSWVAGGGIPGTPVITMTMSGGATGASIISQTEIHNVFGVNGAIVLIVNTGTANGTLTFTNSVDGLSANIAVRAPLSWFVRSDGGTSQSCDGQADAADPGGSGQHHCAFQDIMSLWATTGAFCNDGTPGSVCWKWLIAGGDTALVRDCIQYTPGTDTPIPASSGTCATGAFTSTSTGWSLQGDNNAAGAPNPPNGTQLLHTTIEGYNHASCRAQSSRAPMIGRFGVGEVFPMEGASYVDVSCFDISDQSSCVRAAQNYNFACSHITPYDNFANAAIGWSNTSTNDTISDIRMHGLGVAGMLGPTGDGIVMTDIQIIGNGDAGWNADKGDGVTGIGNTLIQDYEISWSGCSEEFPLVDALPYTNCTDDFSGGYGDGFGTATVLADPPGWHVTFLRGLVSFNTQDGLDALHLVGNSSSMTIKQVTAFSNMGNQIKIGGSPGIVENAIADHNCAALDNTTPIPGVPTFIANYTISGYTIVQPGGPGTPSTMTITYAPVGAAPPIVLGQVLATFTPTTGNRVMIVNAVVDSTHVAGIIGTDAPIVSANSGTADWNWNSGLSDFCRADNEAIVVAVADGTTTSVLYTTIIGAGRGDMGGIVPNGAATGTAALIWQNNIQWGFDTGPGLPSRLTDDIAGGVFAQTGSIISNNFCVAETGTCAISEETSPFTATPGLVDSTWAPFGLMNTTPTSGSSNVVNVGASISGIPVDVSGLARPQSPATHPAVGANEFGNGGPTLVVPITSTPFPGSYVGALSVTLFSATASATICYRTDGVTPTGTSGVCGGGSTTYTGPFVLSSTTTILALGTLSGDTNSTVSTLVYTITGGGPTTPPIQARGHVVFRGTQKLP